MRVIDYEKEIKQTEAGLLTLEKKQSNAKLLLRIQLLRLLKSREFSQIKQVARLLGITSKHGYDLWKKYKAMGLDGYLQLNYQANRAKLDTRQKAELIERAKDGFDSQTEAREFIEREFLVSYTQQGISLLFKRIKIKAKEVRPFNIKADESEQIEYKKTSA
jgi:transposase